MRSTKARGSLPSPSGERATKRTAGHPVTTPGLYAGRIAAVFLGQRNRRPDVSRTKCGSCFEACNIPTQQRPSCRTVGKRITLPKQGDCYGLLGVLALDTVMAKNGLKR